MKKKRNFLIAPFAVMGVCLMLISNCKKDDDTPKVNIANVSIPAGTFTMGSPTNEVGRLYDETKHQVTLSAFRMSKYEITNEQYATFLNSKSIGSDGKYAGGAYPTQILIYESDSSHNWGLKYTDGKWIPVEGCENHPVVFVTWYGAAEFATYAGGRLPTESEWEYACRANTTTPFNTGPCLSKEQANYKWSYTYSTCTNNGTSYSHKTMAVGTHPANDFGLYDMHGNVWEWCNDRYRESYPTTPQTDPTGPTSGSDFVVRGGGWGSGPSYCRSAYRDFYSRTTRGGSIGFRVVF